MDEPRLTLRTYLTLCAMRDVECSMALAMEAVSSVAIEHPQWDMDERRTYAEWMAWEEGH
jgi:hypothetical protein